MLGDYTLVDVKASHGIEKIEADLRERRDEQQAIIRAQENKRASEERERAREKAQRVAELQRQLGNARARHGALGARPIEPEANLLIICWVPLPIGWLVWLGSLQAFLGPRYEIGYVCVALLVVGFCAYQKYKGNDASHSKAIEPFLPVEREIENLETAIKNAGASPAPEAGTEKVVILCPKCEQRMRLPANKTVDVTCPRCREVLRTKT